MERAIAKTEIFPDQHSQNSWMANGHHRPLDDDEPAACLFLDIPRTHHSVGILTTVDTLGILSAVFVLANHNIE